MWLRTPGTLTPVPGELKSKGFTFYLPNRIYCGSSGKERRCRRERERRQEGRREGGSRSAASVTQGFRRNPWGAGRRRPRRSTSTCRLATEWDVTTGETKWIRLLRYLYVLDDFHFSGSKECNENRKWKGFGSLLLTGSIRRERLWPDGIPEWQTWGGRVHLDSSLLPLNER